MRQPGERGMVTAEAALVMPLIAAFAMALAWLITAVINEIRVVDAARDAARAVARGEDEQTAAAAARRTAPDDADVQVSYDGELVTVTVAAHSDPPGWLLVPLPSIPIESSASVAVEGPNR